MKPRHSHCARGWRLADLAGVVLSTLAAAIVLSAATGAQATTLFANPGDSINSKINTMVAGDTLILNPGTYNVAGVTMILITNKVGNANAWFTIKAAQPNTVVIKGNSGRNTCEMRNRRILAFREPRARRPGPGWRRDQGHRKHGRARHRLEP